MTCFFCCLFFLFCHVRELEKIEKNPERLNELFTEEQRIAEFYESLAKEERITAAELGLFLEMTKRAVQNLALNQPRIREGTEQIMGGQILSYATKEAVEKASKEGVQKGVKEGIKEGIKEGAGSQLVSLVQEMKSKGMSFDVVMDIALAGTPMLSPAEVREHVAAVYGFDGSEPNSATD